MANVYCNNNVLNIEKNFDDAHDFQHARAKGSEKSARL